MRIKHINFRRLKWGVALIVLLPFVLTAGCSPVKDTSASNTPIPNFLNPASPIAAKQASLFWILLAISAVVFVIVEGLLLYNIFHHAKSRQDNEEMPPQTYRDYLIEAIYTGLPIIIVIVIFILTLGTIRAIAAPAPKPGDLKVHVVGHRWWWEFDYPDLNIKTANELHIPANTTVQIELDSEDVIHSFYVPQLSGKTDVIPGITNHMWLYGNTVGQFHGQCAEYCGLNHANMRFTVFVDSKADFDAWVANQQKPPAKPQGDLQTRGHDIIVSGVCSACHDLGQDGPGNATGPDLTHLMSRQRFAGDIYDLNEDNLHRWLEDTQAMKPGNDMDHKFSEAQIKALMAYLLTLK
jgi:cytochrome c oxidase subunit 2